jgi:arylsulfatase A-like enzyme
VRRLLLIAVIALALAGCGATSAPHGSEQALTRPNIVFILVDDLQTSLLVHMPNVKTMMQEGTTLDNFFVADSRCCPSRATILTGQLPHNTGVFTNSPPYGGVKAFDANGNPERTFAVTLRDRGYRTALFGKYLNGYSSSAGGVPPGWTDWAATARAYQGFNYQLNENGTPVNYGERSQDYLTDVIAAKGETFVNDSLLDRRPFFLELSTFTPHAPAVAAPRHVGMVGGLKAPRVPAFNRAVYAAPRWLKVRPRMKRPAIQSIDALYRNQVRSVMSVDEMIGRIRARVQALGIADNTYFVFASDNGFHMGEHRLLPGKMTAFDEDIRIPLIVTGPGVPAGGRIPALVQNTDIAPTFEEWAGASPRPEVDGRSLAGLLRGEPVPSDWRAGAIVEHRAEFRSKFRKRDPDAQPPSSGNPPGYNALRTPTATYVEYKTGEREFYDHTVDPHELFNAYKFLSNAEKRNLSVALASLLTCDGAAQCSTLTPPVRRAARAAVSDRYRARSR